MTTAFLSHESYFTLDIDEEDKLNTYKLSLSVSIVAFLKTISFWNIFA